VNSPLIVVLQILLAAGVAVAVLSPLVLLRGRRTWVEPEQEAAIRSVAERKARLYGALLELDFDRDSGKISPEDHAKMKDETMAEVLGVLAEEERLGRTTARRPTVIRGGDRVERLIEEYKRTHRTDSETGA
jgi:hypothetical protein